jgi:hypothetical protein
LLPSLVAGSAQPGRVYFYTMLKFYFFDSYLGQFTFKVSALVVSAALGHQFQQLAVRFVTHAQQGDHFQLDERHIGEPKVCSNAHQYAKEGEKALQHLVIVLGYENIVCVVRRKTKPVLDLEAAKNSENLVLGKPKLDYLVTHLSRTV